MEKAYKILKDLKNNIFHPVYYLMGEEPYYIDLLVDYFETNVLDEAAKSFDQTVFYGRDVVMQEVISKAKQFPMIANKQLIIVKEAQDLTETNPLIDYLNKPQPATILVFAHKYGKVAGSTKLGKAIVQHAEVLVSESIKEKKIAEWVIGYVKDKGYQIETKAAVMVQESLGNDLTKIINEIDKMLLNLTDNQNITAKDVEDNIGFSKDYNFFELQNALSNYNANKAFEIVTHFAKNPKKYPMPLTVASMYNFFSVLLKYHGLPNKSIQEAAKSLGLRDFMLYDHVNASKFYPMRKVSQIIEAIKVLDLKFKGVDSGGIDDNGMLKDFINFVFKK